MPYRSYRGSRRRSSMRPRQVVQSYKKVILHASASFTAGFQQEVMSTGVDSVAAGQTSATDVNVPTGAVITNMEIQFAAANVAAAACFINANVQYVQNNQTLQDPDTIGGNPQRNQVLYTKLYSVGEGQNSTFIIKFKIPKKFQRVREGMSWLFVWNNSASITRKMQVIYKFYR